MYFVCMCISTHCIILICGTFLQPFGEALVTIVVPQLRRGENSLLLWNMSNLSAPIYTFAGHTDVVLEFQWRHSRLGSTIVAPFGKHLI